jgi:hypothetical protein
MKDKRTIIIVTVLLILYVVISVFFWLISNHWFVKLLPIEAIALAELYARKNVILSWVVRHVNIKTKYNDCKVWLHSKQSFLNLLNLLGMNPMPSSSATAQMDTHGDHSNTPMQESTPLSFVSAIKDLRLTDFIECSVSGNITPIILNPKPKYTQDEAEQVAKAWTLLLSEYYTARKDKRADNQRKIVLDAKILETRESVITMLCDSLKIFYAADIADKLKRYYPMFELSKESYLKDITHIFALELPNRLQFKELAKMIDSTTTIERKQSDRPFHDYMNAYNRAFKTSFQIRNLYTDEYAYMCADLDKYYEDLKAQNEKSNGSR